MIVHLNLDRAWAHAALAGDGRQAKKDDFLI